MSCLFQSAGNGVLSRGSDLSTVTWAKSSRNGIQMRTCIATHTPWMWSHLWWPHHLVWVQPNSLWLFLLRSLPQKDMYSCKPTVWIFGEGVDFSNYCWLVLDSLFGVTSLPDSLLNFRVDRFPCVNLPKTGNLIASTEWDWKLKHMLMGIRILHSSQVQAFPNLT